MYIDDTIVAIATPAGRGGVGIVRLSGPESLHIAQKITSQTLKPRYATYTTCCDEQQQVLDEGIVLFFNRPHSYTGEDVVEFCLRMIRSKLFRMTLKDKDVLLTEFKYFPAIFSLFSLLFFI